MKTIKINGPIKFEGTITGEFEIIESGEPPVIPPIEPPIEPPEPEPTYQLYTEEEREEWLGKSEGTNSELVNNEWEYLLNGHPDSNARSHGANAWKNDIWIGGKWDGSTANKTDYAHRYYGQKHEPNNIAHGLKDSAFLYFLTKDTSYGRPVIQFLISQFSDERCTFTNEKLFSDTPWFSTAQWLTKLLRAYVLVKDLANEEEQQFIEQYFTDHADWYERSIHETLRKLFPERKNDDYTIRGLAALEPYNEAYGYREGEYAYQDDEKRNQIYAFCRYYNNRRASVVEFFGHVGILFGIESLYTEATRYIKEWLKFSVFPDGSTGEYERNDPRPYGVRKREVFGGISYNSANIQCAVTLADLCQRYDKENLYEYTTSYGIEGTEGGNKNIKLTIDFYMKHWTQSHIMWNCNEHLYGTTVPKSDGQLLDLINSDSNNRTWINHIYFAPLANRYYNDESLAEVLRQTPASGKFGTAGPIHYPWWAVGAIFPGCNFMWL
jgi:hypothetical protein